MVIFMGAIGLAAVMTVTAVFGALTSALLGISMTAACCLWSVFWIIIGYCTHRYGTLKTINGIYSAGGAALFILLLVLVCSIIAFMIS